VEIFAGPIVFQQALRVNRALEAQNRSLSPVLSCAYPYYPFVPYLAPRSHLPDLGSGIH